MIELLTLGGGALTGFIFKMWANKQKDEADKHKRTMEALSGQTLSADKASEREPQSGKWVRRFIVLVMMTILFLITTGFGTQPTNILSTVELPSYLFGLFGGGTEEVITTVKGALYDNTTRQSILAIIGYYFGNASGQR